MDLFFGIFLQKSQKTNPSLSKGGLQVFFILCKKNKRCLMIVYSVLKSV
jgi:hypothetical protein